jgi:hypothetical protein
METLLSQNTLSDDQRMHLAFALGKAYEDLGEYGKSFNSLLHGNNLKRKTYDYTGEETKGLFQSIKKLCNADFISRHLKNGISDSTPIFIVGMPRSGTSLVEQILASHPDVYGAGELEEFKMVLLDLTKTRILSDAYSSLSKKDKGLIAGIGTEYLSRLRRNSDKGKFITDKMPHNFQHVGIIRLALPNAKIIHCTRDPMDNCFSIYKNYFSGIHRYAYELGELGQYYNLYQDLMKYWYSLFPDFIYEIKYEELVENQEAESKRLIQFCGLPWVDECYSFYNTSRQVATASATQVRKPIYKDSVQLWKKYRSQLEPLWSVLKECYN